MKNNILKKIISKAIISIIIWTLIVYIIFKLLNLYFDLAEFQWLYDLSSDLYYSLKNNYINNNLLFIGGLIIWTSGVLVIIIRVILKLKNLIDALTEAINEVYSKDVEYIKLPKELEELQNKLNHIKKEKEVNEKAAKENEQKKNDLIVYLAHDLKTPLTSNIGYLSLLDEAEDMPRKQQNKYIKIALDKAYKLEELINELFDIARFNSQTIVINQEQLDLKMMLEQLIDDFYPVLKENDKQINLWVKDRVEVMGDSDKLARVFNNLIKNAIYYSQDKQININVQKDNNNVIVEVINKGTIPKDKLSKIFEKFYRADYTRNSKTGGSGLGLAIAKEIVELHKGKISAISSDDYTKFIVELPYLIK